MKPSFAVTVLEFSILSSIEGAWQPADFLTMLDDLDYGDTAGMSSEECREMCVLLLQELQPPAAAALLLKHRLGSRLSSGQIQNVSVEMQDEKMWEEYVDTALHEEMFVVGSLLYEVAPNRFPEPDAVSITLELTPSNKAATDLLNEPLSEAFVVRLVADGMEASASLRRMYDDQLSADTFAEADQIVWTIMSEATTTLARRISLTGSGYWLDALRDTRSYSSTAYADEV